jgi:NAD(P)-dependent dehydrogenase (short-subunit alcohol dehydrogenase family)
MGTFHSSVPLQVNAPFGLFVFNIMHLSFIHFIFHCNYRGYTAYSPSKFALRAFADALKMELTPFGIGVSVLFPPNTNTEGFEEEQRGMPDQVEINNFVFTFLWEFIDP